MSWTNEPGPAWNRGETHRSFLNAAARRSKATPDMSDFSYPPAPAQNEIWAFDKVRPILVDYDKLRYRLMPYIYSLDWRVTKEDYTIQRPLVMDWRTDPNTRDIGDEFMFAPQFLSVRFCSRMRLKNSVFARFSGVVRLLNGRVTKGWA
jgi:Glycosyl hydrolases family 31